MDEFHVALKVAVDHEHLVAAGVGARPLPDLLVVLLYVLLQGAQGAPEGLAWPHRWAACSRPCPAPQGAAPTTRRRVKWCFPKRPMLTPSAPRTTPAELAPTPPAQARESSSLHLLCRHAWCCPGLSPSCRQPLGTRPCSPGEGTCRWWATPPCRAEHRCSHCPTGQRGPKPGPSPLRAQLLLPAWLGPRFLSNFWFFRLLGFFALTLLTRDPGEKKKQTN